jgi:hypothetical protein
VPWFGVLREGSIDEALSLQVGGSWPIRGRPGAGNRGQSFLLSDALYTTLPAIPAAFYTAAAGINAAEQIVGSYRDAGGIIHGFLLSNGAYSTLDPPCSTMAEAWGINDLGHIDGQYSLGGTIHGFVLREGNYTTLDVPGASSTVAYGINNFGQDARGSHGFLATPVNYPTRCPAAVRNRCTGSHRLGRLRRVCVQG